MIELSLKQCVIDKFRGRFWTDTAIMSQLRGYMNSRAYIGNTMICIMFDRNGQIYTHYPLHHDRRLYSIIYRHEVILSNMDDNTYFEFIHENSPDTQYELYRVNVARGHHPTVYVLYKRVAGDESLAAIILRFADLQYLILFGRNI